MLEQDFSKVADKEINEDKDLEALIEQFKNDPLGEYSGNDIDLVEIDHKNQVAKRIRLGLEYATFKVRNGWEKYDVATCEILFEEKMRINAIPVSKILERIKNGLPTREYELPVDPQSKVSNNGSSDKVKSTNSLPKLTEMDVNFDIANDTLSHRNFQDSFRLSGSSRLSGSKAAAIYEYLDSLEMASQDLCINQDPVSSLLTTNSQFIGSGNFQDLRQSFSETASLRSIEPSKLTTNKSIKSRDQYSKHKRSRSHRANDKFDLINRQSINDPLPILNQMESSTGLLCPPPVLIPLTSKIPEPSHTNNHVISSNPVVSEVILKALEEKTKKKKSRKRKSITMTTRKGKNKRQKPTPHLTNEDVEMDDFFGATENSLRNMNSSKQTLMSQKATVSPNTLFHELWATASSVVPQKTASTSMSPGQLFNELWATSSVAQKNNTGAESTLATSISPDTFFDELLAASTYEDDEDEKTPKDSTAESTQTLVMSPTTIFRAALDDWAAVDSNFPNAILSHLPNLPSSPLASSPPHTPSRLSSTVPTLNSIASSSARVITDHLEPPRTPPHQIRSAIDLSTPNSAFSLSEFINMSPTPK
ncbi:10907_t:CDS:2 [Scutellospora calospora]|uniref:10907_t:CDS:1 n=1 Tax=Scutellospora calospora TaxID=85575 RepID=A0ACA9JYD2_9GLOM|nr:10907_t:CDS:2 [Scutellospora calospora]